jgi:hypothetical protein
MIILIAAKGIDIYHSAQDDFIAWARFLRPGLFIEFKSNPNTKTRTQKAHPAHIMLY